LKNKEEIGNKIKNINTKWLKKMVEELAKQVELDH